MDEAIDIEDLSAGWLSAMLDVEVRSVIAEQVGSGQTGATYRLSLDAPGAPPTMIAKVAAGDDAARHRVAAGYRNEVGFYAHLLATVDVRTPACRYAAISEDGCRFTLLLEDLAPRTPGVQADGCPVDRAGAAVRNLAGLHAPRWGDAELHRLDFVSGPTPDGAAFLGQVTTSATEVFVDRYAADLDAADVATLRACAEAIADWVMARPEPFAVIHGDYRLDNLMFGADTDDVVTVDWQTLAIGPPARDVAYFLGTSLIPGDRRAEEERLVEAYHAELRTRGVEGYDADRCFEDYRLGQLQGPLITTLGAAYATAGRSAAADVMFLAMARRSCAAIRELDSLGLV
jgi:aminoglycoside/choline kinase family phosphotransferase